MSIKRTLDYGMFKTHPENRKINSAHVERIKISLSKKSLMRDLPILVAKDGKTVIDGQHRLEAAKQLRLPIFYAVAEDATPEDVGLINSVAKAWSQQDYFDHYLSKSLPSYVKLSEFMKMHGLKLSWAVKILAKTTMANQALVDRGIYEGFTRGTWTYPENDSAAHEWIENYEKFKAASGCDATSVANALISMSRNPNFSWQRILAKVSELPGLVRATGKAPTDIQMLEGVFNRLVKPGQRVYFSRHN